MLSRPVSFVVVGAAGAATLAAASAPSPLYPIYQRLWGFSAFTLTVVFAVYVFALLTALLTVGSLSDRVGRRPVASSALVLLALGMVLFATAGGTGDLIFARVVQGLAVGVATGTTTAMILDAAPSVRLGGVVSSAAPPLGIAAGAVLAGALVQYAPLPRQLVFFVLAVGYLVLAALVWGVAEPARPPSASQEPLWRSLLPSAGLPHSVRPTFVALLPSIGATWALSGLYLSLGSSLLRMVFGVRNHLVAGVVLGVFFTAGIAGTVVSTILPRRFRDPCGYATLAGGVLVTLAALSSSSLPVYVAGSIAAGFGFGAAFRSAVSALGDAAPAARRSQVFATMYIVSYLAFSVPALAAGLAVGQLGIRTTAVTYDIVEIVLVALAALAGTARLRQQVDEPEHRPDATTG